MSARAIEVSSIELSSETHFLSSVSMIQEAMVLADSEALRFKGAAVEPGKFDAEIHARKGWDP